MRVLIAPDKFKGSLDAEAVAENIGAGLRDVVPGLTLDLAPMADGGDGTAEVLGNALKGTWVECTAHNALGVDTPCRYALIQDRKLAIMEMSEAAGMRRILGEPNNLLCATTIGVGEMLLHAARNGVSEIIVGLGGSATNDGGLGMARALGFRFLRADGSAIESVAELARLDRIKPPDVEALVPSAFGGDSGVLQASVQIIAATDVRNPLLGERGATRIFGPQKGATPEQLEVLERALTRLAEVVATDLKCDFRDVAGAGAAGGLGFGLLSFAGATIQSGFEAVARAVDLESRVKEANMIVTGEGKLDHQTAEGKVPAGVSRLARIHGKPVYAIVGRSTGDREAEAMFDRVLSLSRDDVSESDSVKRAAELLRERARELATGF